MKTILLIKPEPAHNPFSLDIGLRTEPLELEYISAMLKEEGWECLIYEAVLENRTIGKYLGELTARGKELPFTVLITGYITQENLMKRYARQVKRCIPGVKVFAGGSHVQHNFEHFYDDCFDGLFRSDNIDAIAACLKGDAFETLDGFVWKEGESWRVNPCRPFDIRDLPFPDRSLAQEHWGEYRYLDVHGLALVKTSTACPYSCSFCYGRLLNCGRYTRREPAQVVRELEGISCENIQFVDDDFLYDKNWLEEFLTLLEKKKIRKQFICYARADFLCREEEFLFRLYGNGFRCLMVGLEADSDERLERYEKRTDTSLNRKAVKNASKAGLKVVGLFIADLDFVPADFRKLKEFIRETGLIYAGVSIFTPIPGTAVYEQYRDGLLTRNPEKWDFMHLVVRPVHMGRIRFYLHYYALVWFLYRLAKRNGVYDFLTFGSWMRAAVRSLTGHR